jgi:tripartite-type tricarboxylate transporter receptor subunit TctC
MTTVANRPRSVFTAAVLAAAVTLAATPARADDFFAGKTITISIGTGPGGSYDAYARLMARHLGRHIAGNPTLVQRNMPGAGGTRVAAFIYNVAPKDGTHLGATLNTIPVFQLLNPGKAKYDVGKFNWIGTTASPTNILVVWHTTGVKTLEEATKKAIPLGATTSGTTQEMYPLMTNRLFGTKFKVVLGYGGANEVNLALERGEVLGRGSNSWMSYLFQHPSWVKEKKIVPLFQMTLERDPMLKDVPTLLELATTDEQRAVISLLATTETIGRAMMGPPGMAADRVTLLRKAFADAIRDPALRADADKAKLEIQPIEGSKLQSLVERISSASPDVVARFKAAVASENPGAGKKKSRKSKKSE